MLGPVHANRTQLRVLGAASLGVERLARGVVPDEALERSQVILVASLELAQVAVLDGRAGDVPELLIGQDHEADVLEDERE